MKTTEVIQDSVAGVIAIITILGALAITAYQLTHNQTVTVPEWVTLLIGAVVGAYFTRAASQNGARQAGTAAAQVAVSAANAAHEVTPDVPSVPPTT